MSVHFDIFFFCSTQSIFKNHRIHLNWIISIQQYANYFGSVNEQKYNNFCIVEHSLALHIISRGIKKKLKLKLHKEFEVINLKYKFKRRWLLGNATTFQPVKKRASRVWRRAAACQEQPCYNKEINMADLEPLPLNVQDPLLISRSLSISPSSSLPSWSRRKGGPTWSPSLSYKLV